MNSRVHPQLPRYGWLIPDPYRAAWYKSCPDHPAPPQRRPRHPSRNGNGPSLGSATKGLVVLEPRFPGRKGKVETTTSKRHLVSR